MNVILLEDTDWADAHHVVLRGRRHHHVRDILKATVGERVRVGLLGGNRGDAEIIVLDEQQVQLRPNLDTPPPPRHPLRVVLALPRPKMLRRVLRCCAEFGVSELHLIHSYRVEKSYWQSPLLQQERIDEALRAGLERSGDTLPPIVVQHRRFRPFIEDRLPELAGGQPLFLLTPGPYATLAADSGNPAVVLVGPEGGFIPFEVELAQANGATARTLGSRILSVDTALNTVLARELR